MTEEIIARIRKLLALSNSPNEAEAALAASRAQELLTRHNIDIGVVNRPEEQTATSKSTDARGRFDAYTYILASAMDTLFDVRHYKQQYRSGRKISGELVFVGLAANVEAALITLGYLTAAIDEMAKSRRKSGEIWGTSQIRDYKVGAAIRIRDNVRAHKAQSTTQIAQGNQLVLVGQQIAQRALDAVLANGSRKRSTLGGIRNGNAYHLGQRDGATINPHAARSSRQLGSAS